MRWPSRRLVEVVCGGFLLAYVLSVALQIEEQTVPDYATFYAVARELLHGGAYAAHHLYSIKFQLAADSFLDRGPGQSYVEPFVALPPAAWVVIPFAWMSLWASFYTWDAICLGLCLLGCFWLVRQQHLGPNSTLLALGIAASYPTYAALSEGQYDLLWPLCIALFTSAWYCSSARRRWPRVAAASLLFSFKPDLLLLMVVPALARWRRRVLWEAALCLVVLAGLSVAWLGKAGLLRLPALESYTLFQRFPPKLDTTVLAILWRAMGPGSLTRDLAWAALALALLGLTVAWWRNPPRSGTDWKLALTTTVCLSLAVAPHALNHDLMLLAAPAVWVAVALRDSGRSLRPLALWIVLFNLVIVIDSTPRFTLPLPLTPVLLLVAAGVAWRARTWLARGPVPTPAGAGALKAPRPSLPTAAQESRAD